MTNSEILEIEISECQQQFASLVELIKYLAASCRERIPSTHFPDDKGCQN
jgi:hypothetical protein